ncbi:TBC1 domain, member 5 [Podila humilis]|nr:TBC1 domain, member 5 [Podila humilis]
MKSVLDSNYIEHDTFALFSSLMSRAKPWYEFSDDGFGGRKLPKPNSTVQTQIFGKSETPEAPAAKQTPVIEWSERIFFYLEKVDNELFTHLKNLEIQPQLFGIRWFRLLFGREFPMEVVLNLWDGIFAIDPSLNIVIFIGLAMLLKIRDELLEQDFSGCLHKLMRYPEVKDTHLFISQGLRLQKSPTAAGGLEIIRQNHTLAGKPLPPLPSTEQASSPDYHSSNSPHSSQHYTTQQKHPSYQSHAHPDHARSNIFPSNGVLSQHLPPAALDAIKPVAEGFVHVTKNVLESKGGAALNKAIHDMKKNTQSYIRKANTVPPLPAAPSFPPMFDQAISSTGRLAASSRPAPSPSTQLPTSQSRSTSQLVSCSDKDLRSQLGQIVAKAIVILESELSTKAEAAEKTPKPTTKEAMAAIFGLEHVRDNLLGLTKELDPLVIESKMLDSPPKPMGQQPHKHVPQDTQIISKNAELQGPTIHAPQTTQTVNLSSPSRTVATHAVSANTNYPRAGGVQCTDARNSLEGTNLPRNASHGVSSGLEYRFDAGGEVYSGSGSGSGHRSESGTGSANSSPSLAPVRASTPIKQSQPFSFDDLLNDTSDSTPTSRSRHQGKDRVAGVARSGDTPSNVKSPRSSLAHSQFSWILNDDNAEGGGAGGPASQPGSMLSSSLSSSSNSSMTKHAMSGVVGSGLSSTSNGGGHNHPRPAAEIFSPLNSSSRMKLDPLAGNVSKRSTSFGRSADISSGAGGKVQSLDDDDPLRVHS